jgi:hypothetical protein
MNNHEKLDSMLLDECFWLEVRIGWTTKERDEEEKYIYFILFFPSKLLL